MLSNYFNCFLKGFPLSNIIFGNNMYPVYSSLSPGLNGETSRRTLGLMERGRLMKRGSLMERRQKMGKLIDLIYKAMDSNFD
jgi:hypothetical protein